MGRVNELDGYDKSKAGNSRFFGEKIRCDFFGDFHPLHKSLKLKSLEIHEVTSLKRASILVLSLLSLTPQRQFNQIKPFFDPLITERKVSVEKPRK